MGAFYGSVHVRTEDRESVKVVAEKVARAKQIHCLVGPALGGWVGVYPEGHGQDSTVGAEMARELKEDVLYLVVHDDSVFAYWLYRSGTQVDSYWSVPGYFGEEDREQEEKMVGDPEIFRRILGDKVSRLRLLLSRDREPEVFASEQMEKFAKVLKISNVAHSYEDLKDGERFGLKGWRKFEEVPDDSERTKSGKKKNEKNRVKAEIKRLKEEGLLLAIDTRKEGMALCCRTGDGLVAAWTDPAPARGTVSLERYDEPWDRAKPLALDTPKHVSAIASDAAGRRIAMAAGDRVRVWDIAADGWKHLVDIAEPNGVYRVAVSPDGGLIAHGSLKEIVITNVKDGDRLVVVSAGIRGEMAFHPSGEWLAVGGSTLGLIALREQPHWRELFIGGRSKLSEAMALILQEKARDIDVEALRKQWCASMDRMQKRMGKKSGTQNKLAISQEKLEEMERQAEDSFKQTETFVIAMKEGRLPPEPPRANEETRCVGFSRDGQWLWCGTNVGLRIYEWATFPRQAGAETFSPRWKFESPYPPVSALANYIFAVVEEVEAAGVVFGDGFGRIFRLDLATGEVHAIAELLSNAMVVDLAMCSNGQVLGITTVSSPSMGGFQDQRTWQAWSYPQMRGQGKGVVQESER